MRDALYFVLVDRFANGDPSNDGDVQPRDPQGWHGGDVVGVTQRLDYLEGLGVGAVWLSPITASRQDRVDEWGAFHGYWVSDHRSIEPRFGSLEDAVALSDALHARDMRLYLDMVWNHVGYDAPLTRSRPEWFHGNGDVIDWDDPVQATTHDVHGLPDLAQEREEVAAYLTDASRWWAESVQPDGFRVDAVRHLPSPFIRQIGDVLRAERPGFVLLGEHFEGDPRRLAERYRSDRFDAVFDFPMHYAMKDVFCRDAHPGRIASTLAADHAYGEPDRVGGLQHLVPFLDNHDVPRVMSVCEEDADRVARALAFMVTTRGTPCIYQGTEAGQAGAEEPHNRADMDFDAAHPLADTLRELLDIRARHVALREGITRLDRLEDDRLLYSRLAAGAAARIAVNASDQEWVLPPADAGLQRTSAHVVVGAGSVGTLGSTLPPHSVAVELLSGPAEALIDAVRERRSTKSTVTIRAEDVPVAPGERVVLVGAGESLGRWNPASAPEGVREGEDVSWTISTALDDVLTFKIVIVGASETRWSPGSDFYVRVGGPELERVVSWRAGEG